VHIHASLQEGGGSHPGAEGQSIFVRWTRSWGIARYSEIQPTSRMVEAGFTMEAMLRFNRVFQAWLVANGKILKRRTISRSQLKNFDRLVWLFGDRCLPRGTRRRHRHRQEIGRVKNLAHAPLLTGQSVPRAQARPIGAQGTVDRPDGMSGHGAEKPGFANCRHTSVSLGS